MSPVMRCFLMLMLLATLRILPAAAQETQPPALAVERGGLEISEDLPPDQVTELASILQRLDETLRSKEIGLVASRWNSDGQLIYRLRYNDPEPYAIASTFKAFAAFYYFMTMPREQWNTGRGSNVYNMVVFSDNTAAGNILALTADVVPGNGNPIEKFNDFMQTFFGLSDLSGIHAWDAGALANQQLVDARFVPDVTQPGRYVTLYGDIYAIRNRFTARDTALATERLARIPFDAAADAKTRLAYQMTRTLMSVSDSRYRTNFDTIAFDTGAWRKYGYLSEADAGAEARSEIVVIPTPDGGHLVIAMLSGAENGDSFRGALGQLFRDLARFDHDMLPEHIPVPHFGGIPRSKPVEGRFNYGFVMPVQLNIYVEPDEASALIANPLRDDMIFPVAPVYQGALLRFTPLDQTWAKLDWNSNNPPFRGAAAYIRLSDVYTIPDTLFLPVSQVIGWETPPRKYLILDKTTELLHLMENDSIVFTTPVIVNPRDTLDGEHGIGTRRLSDSRTGFPFVNFVSVYGENGQSLYTAPWQWWTQTYTRHDSRYSSGDILVPDWFVTIPGWGRARADIFIFRWLGGFASPAESLVEPAQSQVLLFVVRSNLDELLSMTYQGRERTGIIGWREIIRQLTGAPVIAPAAYFADF